MLEIVCITLANFISLLLATPSFIPDTLPLGSWRDDPSHTSNQCRISLPHEDQSHLELSLALPSWTKGSQAEAMYASSNGPYQDEIEGGSGTPDNEDAEGDNCTSSGSKYVYPWNLMPAGSIDKIEVVRRYIQAQPRKIPQKNTDETDDEYQYRLQKSWQLFERKKRTELKHLDKFEQQCNGDQDQTAALYEERLTVGKEKKKAADKIRHREKRLESKRLLEGQESHLDNQRLLPLTSGEEEQRIEAAKKLYLECQQKSMQRLRLKKAKEAGINDELIAEEMTKWELDTLDDQRPMGAIKTALRKKLQRFPNDEQLRMQAVQLGMDPDIQPTPRKGVKGKERWLHGSMNPESSLQRYEGQVEERQSEVGLPNLDLNL